MKFLFSFYHWLWSVFGRIFYGNPSKNMTVVGITGTKGKSTVVDLTTKILEEAGCKVASISSLRIKIVGKEWENKLKMTTPGHAFLQKFLYMAKKQGATYAVIEVSSEGIKQFRHKGIDFDIAALTNLSPEHIESHGSFEKYQAAKEKLFEALSRSKKPKRIMAVNGDDPSAEYFLKYDADEKWVYSKNYELRITNYEKFDPNLKILKAENYKLSEKGIELEIENQLISSPLLGEFNLENVLAAIAINRSLNIGWEKIKSALKNIEKIPGRLEFIDEGQSFKVVVDYAHTPDSLEKVYKNLKAIFNPNRLICVLGSAGGGRDKWKRPELGKIANQYCKKVIATNEDPYDEDPQKIISQVANGFNFEKISDRKEAIQEAIKNAEAGDAVIITGKGAEPWMMGPHGTKIPWDDREIARKILKENLVDE